MKSLPSIDHILDLEKEILNGLISGDSSSEELLISKDFVGIYPDEITDKNGHLEQLRNGPIISAYFIENPAMIELSSDVVCLYYKVTMFPLDATVLESPRTNQYYESSLWKILNSEWRNVFSQSTILIK